MDYYKMYGEYLQKTVCTRYTRSFRKNVMKMVTMSQQQVKIAIKKFNLLKWMFSISGFLPPDLNGSWTDQSEVYLCNKLQEAELTETCVSPQLCWQKAENDDLLGELLFMPCLTWIKIKLEVYELCCLFWHLYELWARLTVIYVYSSSGRKKEIKKPKQMK